MLSEVQNVPQMCAVWHEKAKHLAQQTRGHTPGTVANESRRGTHG